MHSPHMRIPLYQATMISDISTHVVLVQPVNRRRGTPMTITGRRRWQLSDLTQGRERVLPGSILGSQRSAKSINQPLASFTQMQNHLMTKSHIFPGSHPTLPLHLSALSSMEQALSCVVVVRIFSKRNIVIRRNGSEITILVLFHSRDQLKGQKSAQKPASVNSLNQWQEH